MGKHVRYSYPEVGDWMCAVGRVTDTLEGQHENLTKVADVLDTLWSGEAPQAAIAVIEDQIKPNLAALIEELLAFRAAILQSALDMNDRDKLLADGPVTTALDTFAAIV